MDDQKGSRLWSRGLSRAQWLPISILLCALVLLPLFLVTVPPLVDYPNHLARCSILAQLPHSPLLSSIYEPRNVVLPNLAMDAIVVPLCHVMPALLAGKIFCGLVLLVMFTGGIALNAACGRKLTLWSFVPALLLYNHIYVFGFLNYLFGIGLMLWGLAGWIYLRERPWGWRIGTAASFAVVLFFCHLMAVFFFGVALLGWEISHWRRDATRRFGTLRRDLGLLALVFIAPILLLKMSPTQAEVGVYLWDTWANKWNEALQLARIDPSHWDETWTYALFAVVGLAFALGVLKVEKRMRLAVGLVFVAFIALPLSFATSSEVDVRVPIVCALLLLASSEFRFSRPKLLPYTIVATSALFGLRMVQVTLHWSDYGKISDQLAHDISVVPPASLVFTAADRHVELYEEEGWDPPLIHVALLAAPRGVFFPQIFALPNQHPLAIRPEFHNIGKFEGSDPLTLLGGSWVPDLVERCRRRAGGPNFLPPALNRGTYLLVFTTPNQHLSPSPDADLLVQRERYALFRIHLGAG